MDLIQYLAQFAPLPTQHFENTYRLARNAPNTDTYLRTSTYDLINTMPGGQILARLPGMGALGTMVGGIHDLLQGQFGTAIPDAIQRFRGFVDYRQPYLNTQTQQDYQRLMNRGTPTTDQGSGENKGGGGGGISNFSQRPAPQKVKINAPAFKGMGYTRGR